VTFWVCVCSFNGEGHGFVNVVSLVKDIHVVSMMKDMIIQIW